LWNAWPPDRAGSSTHADHPLQIHPPVMAIRTERTVPSRPDATTSWTARA
jgi:hypothetical protein